MASGGRQSPGPFGSTKSTSATWPPAPGVASFPARALTASHRCLLDGAEGGNARSTSAPVDATLAPRGVRYEGARADSRPPPVTLTTSGAEASVAMHRFARAHKQQTTSTHPHHS